MFTLEVDVWPRQLTRSKMPWIPEYSVLVWLELHNLEIKRVALISFSLCVINSNPTPVFHFQADDLPHEDDHLGGGGVKPFHRTMTKHILDTRLLFYKVPPPPIHPQPKLRHGSSPPPRDDPFSFLIRSIFQWLVSIAVFGQHVMQH